MIKNYILYNNRLYRASIQNNSIDNLLAIKIKIKYIIIWKLL